MVFEHMQENGFKTEDTLYKGEWITSEKLIDNLQTRYQCPHPIVRKSSLSAIEERLLHIINRHNQHLMPLTIRSDQYIKKHALDLLEQVDKDRFTMNSLVSKLEVRAFV